MLTTVAATLATNPQPQLPGFLNAVGGQLNHYGLWAVLLLVMVEDFGIPVPGETVLIAAAIFAGAGRLNIVAVGVVGFVAAILGDNIGFAIGHFGGRALALRWGKYIFLTEERLIKAEFFFERHGGKIIVVARFIEGLRQANGIIAGISGMHWRRFVIYNAIGAGLWVGTWVSIGYFAGSHINTIYHYITAYSYYVLIAAGVLVAALIVRHILRRRRRAARRRGPETQENVEVKADAGTQESSEAALDSSEVNAGTPDSSGAQGGTGPQDSTGSQADSAADTDTRAQADAGSQANTGAGADTGAEASAGAQSGTQDGAGTQESAKTQSS